MIKQKILEAYEELAEKYNELIDHKPHNAFYDRPNTLSLLPQDIKGKNILDAACGPGKYAEILIERGARVTGFDLSPRMVELAKARNGEAASFFVHDMSEPFEQLSDNSFDVVICALAMHYLKDWTSTVREFYRVLKPGGKAVISMGHPFFDYGYFKSTNYFETEPVRATWSGFGKPVEVNSYRRSLQDCLTPFTENGFYIDKLLEPRPTPEFEQYDPRHYNELNLFPGFMHLRVVRQDRQQEQMKYTIQTVKKSEYKDLIKVWEASVRATHDFLKEEDIEYFKPLILNSYFDAVDLQCVRSEKGVIIGFSGVAEGNLEMLFIHPDYRGCKVGKTLLDYSIQQQGVTKVDVNEQNEQAVGFYRHCGFKVVGRSALDGTGKPYPILHMTL